ncbi:uncharacterized protein FIBRA_03689 [Fibroporia radiculosa]|uniref:Uncharacterized protein n=1 Tax=Fibroporia radiculosa TaxID=599839 RepID=J4G663_9APHY|nr:uncharacterized protein FIBRA_03689 [Fibroporia radiculosa]CCM01628.1 predicted protein [Fibroporia radiculosa]
MNSLPSPPLQPLAHDLRPYHKSHPLDPAMDSLLASVWHSIQQSPPPSLRDILDAYRTKGDGDRDMLIAMLNAKSAEDQRIASLASLQRTMLEMYQPSLHPPAQPIPPLHLSAEGHHYSHHHHHHSSAGPAYPSVTHMPSPPHTSYYHSPHPQTRSGDDEPLGFHVSHHRTDSGVSSSSPISKETLLVSVESPSRKRRRSSLSPGPSRDRVRRSPLGVTTHDLPLPPSPYSSASSHSSSGGSPRSRESMAIGALLSTSQQGRNDARGRRSSNASDRHPSTSAREARS